MPAQISANGRNALIRQSMERLLGAWYHHSLAWLFLITMNHVAVMLRRMRCARGPLVRMRATGTMKSTIVIRGPAHGRDNSQNQKFAPATCRFTMVTPTRSKDVVALIFKTKTVTAFIGPVQAVANRNFS